MDIRLEAYFHQLPPNVTLEAGTIFRVTGFARVETYTLVAWRLGGEVEYAVGETLYNGRNLLASGGGTLPLYELSRPAVQSATPATPSSVWDRVDSRIGAFGLPAATAIALRDTNNAVYFEA